MIFNNFQIGDDKEVYRPYDNLEMSLITFLLIWHHMFNCYKTNEHFKQQQKEEPEIIDKHFTKNRKYMHCIWRNLSCMPTCAVIMVLGTSCFDNYFAYGFKYCEY